MKAKRFLENKNINFVYKDAKEGIDLEDLIKWYSKSKTDIDKFFNTSGKVYKELDLKNKIKTMSLEEKLLLLSENGMLLKRPLLILQDEVLIGFKEDVWQDKLDEI